MSNEDFADYANDIDYALIFHNPEDYRFSATALFFDALSNSKPIIALKNPFINYYFEKLGDIGYLCDNYDEMKDVVLNILDKNPKSIYRNQKQNLLKGQVELSLYKISDKFAELWNFNR